MISPKIAVRWFTKVANIINPNIDIDTPKKSALLLDIIPAGIGLD